MNDHSETIRDALTTSAFEFLSRAAQELERSPRDASIHLSAALELLMKARLAHEHWSLVDKRPGATAFERVHRGDFQSVSFSEAIERLSTIAAVTWHPHQRKILESVASHRNKLLHFYNPALNDTRLKALVAFDQCRAWSVFRELLEGAWAEAFPDIERELDLVSTTLRKSASYLRVRFEDAAPALRAAQASGKTIHACGVCGFEALIQDELEFAIIAESCVVCEILTRHVRWKCQTCTCIFGGPAAPPPGLPEWAFAE